MPDAVRLSAVTATPEWAKGGWSPNFFQLSLRAQISETHGFGTAPVLTVRSMRVRIFDVIVNPDNPFSHNSAIAPLSCLNPPSTSRPSSGWCTRAPPRRLTTDSSGLSPGSVIVRGSKFGAPAISKLRSPVPSATLPAGSTTGGKRITTVFPNPRGCVKVTTASVPQKARLPTPIFMELSTGSCLAVRSPSKTSTHVPSMT
mmetsp:Transcript_36700/g.82609  ORF Transcript_36700/g.82609 Transcript_36700/m.82609 type:complete len:201 (-) Transcript_36700:140-742(-)